MLSDIEIAQGQSRGASSRWPGEVRNREEHLDPYGHYKAKLSLEFIRSLEDGPDGELILISGISPTPPGEGKTTTTVGLGDALNRIGERAITCIREPSLGPVFGIKGGAAGGRVRAGHPHGGYQPALHGRLQRHSLGQQPPRRSGGQPRSSGQRSRVGSASHSVEARCGHER